MFCAKLYWKCVRWGHFNLLFEALNVHYSKAHLIFFLIFAVNVTNIILTQLSRPLLEASTLVWKVHFLRVILRGWYACIQCISSLLFPTYFEQTSPEPHFSAIITYLSALHNVHVSTPYAHIQVHSIPLNGKFCNSKSPGVQSSSSRGLQFLILWHLNWVCFM